MYSKILSIPSLIVIGLLVLYSVDQASALRCYGCESTSTGLCWRDGKSAPTGTCVPVRSLALDSATSSANTTIQEAMAALGHENSTSVGPTYYPYSFDCAKLVGIRQGYDYIIRMCTLEQIPCEVYNARAAQLGFVVTSCKRCSRDLCNSSNSINAGIMSLIVFATLFFFQK